MTLMRMGCCSAVSPCSHQQRDPLTLCETCSEVERMEPTLSAGQTKLFPGKMPSRTQAWYDRFYLKGARWYADGSKDPSTQVGAVIVRPNGTVASFGYNGFPRKILDLPERLNDRELKLKYTVHGEINAITWAREPLDGYTLYTWPFLTCAKCALHVIQAGIIRVVAPVNDNPRWKDSFKEAQDLYDEANVKWDLIDYAPE